MYGHRKRVCTESWLWKKNPSLHRGIEPVSAACRTEAVLTELHPLPRVQCRCVSADSLRLTGMTQGHVTTGVLFCFPDVSPWLAETVQEGHGSFRRTAHHLCWHHGIVSLFVCCLLFSPLKKNIRIEKERREEKKSSEDGNVKDDGWRERKRDGHKRNKERKKNTLNGALFGSKEKRFWNDLAKADSNVWQKKKNEHCKRNSKQNKSEGTRKPVSTWNGRQHPHSALSILLPQTLYTGTTGKRL